MSKIGSTICAYKSFLNICYSVQGNKNQGLVLDTVFEFYEQKVEFLYLVVALQRSRLQFLLVIWSLIRAMFKGHSIVSLNGYGAV